jgi:TolA-binding protein
VKWRDEAKVKLYQYIIDRHPKHEQVVPAQARLGQIMIRRGDDHGAEALFQKILRDYRGHPRLAEAVHLMADGYLDQSIALEKAESDRVGAAQYAKIVQEGKRSEAVKDYCRRALEKWQIVIRDLPPTPRYTEHAWYFTGVVYRRHLDEPEKAIPYYEKVAQTWPDYQYAWSAQAMLAHAFEALARSGKMTKQEAEPKIEQAHRAVLERYPDCSLAAPACLALADLHLKNQRWDQAAPYLQQFLERYPQAREWANALILLGLTYERRDKPEIAAELYRSYLASATQDDPRVKMVQAKLDEGKEVQP